MKPEILTQWTSEKSSELYGVHNWGFGYFEISPEGYVIVRPRKNGSNCAINLHDIATDLAARDINMPVLLRFSDILETQIRLINESFISAISETGYKGSYRGVYPIKVNQKQQVVQDILDFGKNYHHGLEAGSKAEIIAAITTMQDPEAFIICNGYKDAEFIDLALSANKMGLQTVIVIEMLSEIPIVIEQSRKLKVKPRLGLRAKLSARAGGHWDGSGGDRSKFGLDSMQIVEAVDMLKSAGMLDSLEMLHYHLGSQVPDIRRIRTAIREACRFYSELVREGARMGIINVGGGLAVDYDGSSTNFASSRNYSCSEYATDIVEAIKQVTDESNIPHPMIVSESGRATVAHHSVLLFNVLNARRFEPHSIPDSIPDTAPEPLSNLMETLKTVTPRNIQEAYHDALYYRDEVRSMFLHGNASLRERAMAENIFREVIAGIAQRIRKQKYTPDEMEELDSAIADIYYSNFSLFQSLPDSWAVDQLFPVMPVHRLNEMPDRQAIIADITCDSDGKISSFIDLHDVRRTLPLHKLNDHPYILGAFLVGAYQETLGDMHNLLGNVNVVHVRIDDDGNVEYIKEVPGDSVQEVLTYVEYNPHELMQRLRTTAQNAVKAKLITAREKRAIIQAFDDGMKGYTYFEI